MSTEHARLRTLLEGHTGWSMIGPLEDGSWMLICYDCCEELANENELADRYSRTGEDLDFDQLRARAMADHQARKVAEYLIA